MGVGVVGRKRSVCGFCAALRRDHSTSLYLFFFLFSFSHGCRIHINSLGVLFRGTGAWCILGVCVFYIDTLCGGGFHLPRSLIYFLVGEGGDGEEVM